jgi:hypothetical protein
MRRGPGRNLTTARMAIMMVAAMMMMRRGGKTGVTWMDGWMDGWKGRGKERKEGGKWGVTRKRRGM